MVSNRKTLLFDISELTDEETVVGKFPEILKYKEFNKISKQDKVIRYIIYMYDLASELIKQYPKLKERKEAAIELAGIKTLNPLMKEILEGSLKSEGAINVFNAILCYLRLQNNNIWTEICTLEEELAEYVKLRWKTVEDDKDKDTIAAAEKKSKLREYCKEIIKDLEQYKKEFFNGDDEIADTVQDIKITSPETFAQRYV